MAFLAMALMTSTVMSEDQLTMSRYTYLSHLSPLFNYTPLKWDVSLNRHYSNLSGATVEWYGFANSVEIQGNQSNTEVEVVGAGDDDPDNTMVYRNPQRSLIAWIVRNGFTGPSENVYNVSISTNTSTGSYIEFDKAYVLSTVPADESAMYRDSGLPVAIHQSATDSDFFRDIENAWAVMEPPSNQSVGVQWQDAWGELPTNGAEFPWDPTVLSTTQVGAPLRFSIPPYTSYLQWDGTVGPDQGRYEFRLIPTGDKEPQFRPISNNQTYTGERSVNAINEVKVIAWLDPRCTYDAEIVLLEEGKRTDLHGISFWRYTEM